jgi:hypothetical protein
MTARAVAGVGLLPADAKVRSQSVCHSGVFVRVADRARETDGHSPVSHLQANRRELAKSPGAPQSAEHVFMSPVRPSRPEAPGHTRSWSTAQADGRGGQLPYRSDSARGQRSLPTSPSRGHRQVRRLWRRPYPRLDRRVQAGVMYSTPFGELHTEPITSKGGENTWPRRMTVAGTPRRTGVTVSSRPLESAAAPAGDRCRRRLRSGSPAYA